MSAAVAVILTALTISGCSAPAGPDPAPVTAPMFASDEEAFAAAEATLEAYVAASNRIDLADPATFEPIFRWTSGELSAAERKGFSKLHAAGAVKRGDEVITAAQLSNVDRKAGTVSLAVCLDVSAVELTNADGLSRVHESRDDEHALVVEFEPSDASETGLLINFISGRDGEPKCTG